MTQHLAAAEMWHDWVEPPVPPAEIESFVGVVSDDSPVRQAVIAVGIASLGYLEKHNHPALTLWYGSVAIPPSPPQVTHHAALEAVPSKLAKSLSSQSIQQTMLLDDASRRPDSIMAVTGPLPPPPEALAPRPLEDMRKRTPEEQAARTRGIGFVSISRVRIRVGIGNPYTGDLLEVKLEPDFVTKAYRKRKEALSTNRDFIPDERFL